MRKGIEIVIAEANPTVSFVLQSAINEYSQRGGFSVRRVPNGADACASVESGSILLLDFRMPDMDCYEVLKRLRESGVSPKAVAMISCSAMESHEIKEASHAVSILYRGSIAYFPKPKKAADLMEWPENIAEWVYSRI